MWVTADRSTTELRWIGFVNGRELWATSRAEQTAFSTTIITGYSQPEPGMAKREFIGCGERFEPAVPQSRDYEPSWGAKPVERKNPRPPFCRFNKFSSFRASPNDNFLLFHTHAQGPRPLVQCDPPSLCCPLRRRTSSLTPNVEF